MSSLRNTCGPNLRTRKTNGQQPNSIPDLFIRAFHECRRRKRHLFPPDHPSWTSEQLQEYITIAWEKAGPHRQKFYWNPAETLSNSRSQSVETGTLVANDVKRAPRITSRARGRKAPSKSRTKRTFAAPPPVIQAQPATPPPLDDLEPMSPLTPHSRCSSVSIPLQMVVQSQASAPPPESGGLPHAQHAGGASPLHLYPLSTAERNEGAASSAASPSFPYVPPGYLHIHPPPALCPALSMVAHAQPGMWRGLPGPASDDGVPVPEIDPSLLDMQRQTSEQMSRYYPSTHPSLNYAHMSSALDQWPWR